jgi:hypothetical protein
VSIKMHRQGRVDSAAALVYVSDNAQYHRYFRVSSMSTASKIESSGL